MSNEIYAYWFTGVNNFGDVINPYLIRRLSGKEVILNIEPSEEKITYLCVGSILSKRFQRDKEKYCHVWGAGLIQEGKMACRVGEIFAVRGLLTRTILQDQGIKCPDIYGDPAILLPYYFWPTVPDTHPIGIIPHYVDKNSKWVEQYKDSESVKIIDVSDPVERVLLDILSCGKIISSSLHGLVVADAYGIPTVWAEFSKKVRGEGFKFYDYFTSIDAEPYSPIQLIDSNANINDVASRAKYMLSDKKYNEMAKKLMSVCPFKI